MNTRRTRVVVLGSGYAGVRVAHDLADAATRGMPLEVVLVSNKPYHLDTPALYEVATGYLAHESLVSSETIARSVCVPLTDIFKRLPVHLLTGSVGDIDPARRLVLFKDKRSLSFDGLVLALGTTLATAGVTGVREYAFNVKTLHAALELRHHVVRQCLMARELPNAAQSERLSFVVVGGGAAGVETAAELRFQVAKLCAKYGIDPQRARITLVEAGPDILLSLPPAARDYARRRLAALAVTIITGRPIAAVLKDQVVFRDQAALPSPTTVWAGGLAVHPVLVGSELPLRRWGVLCQPTMQVVGHPAIFAAGDCAVLPDYPEKIPAVVPVAYQQASLVAANIVRQLKRETLQEYRYQSLGAIIAVGAKVAVATFAHERVVTGYLAWLLKQAVSVRYWARYLSWPGALTFWRHSVALYIRND